MTEKFRCYKYTLKSTTIDGQPSKQYFTYFPDKPEALIIKGLSLVDTNEIDVKISEYIKNKCSIEKKYKNFILFSREYSMKKTTFIKLILWFTQILENEQKSKSI